MGIIPGKLFEYLAAKRPILAIGPTNGDSAAILQQTGGGEVIDYSDTPGILNALKQYYNAFQEGTLASHAVGIEKYSRKNLAQAYCSHLNQISN